jgi:hypothetical protein
MKRVRELTPALMGVREAVVTHLITTVFLAYGNKPPALGLSTHSIHGATFGVGLQKRCIELGVECHVVYPSAPDAKYKSPIEYLIATLK